LPDKILSYSQRIVGGEHFLNWQQDPFANWNARIVFAKPMKAFGRSRARGGNGGVNPFDYFLETARLTSPSRTTPL